jgi:Domain of unknown function (DUF4136)
MRTFGAKTRVSKDLQQGPSMISVRTMRLSLRLAAAIGLILIGGNVAAQKVTTQVSGKFNFAENRRYAWRANHLLTRQGKQTDELIDKKIVQSVDQTLASKGFVKDTERPQFYIFYDAGAPQMNADLERSAQSFTPTPYGQSFYVVGLQANVWISVDGEINFHVVDAASNSPVWTAICTKKIRDPQKVIQNLDKEVGQIVSKAFKSFPSHGK